MVLSDLDFGRDLSVKALDLGFQCPGARQEQLDQGHQIRPLFQSRPDPVSQLAWRPIP